MEGKKSSDKNTQSMCVWGGPMLVGGRENNSCLHVNLTYQFVQCKQYLVGNPCLGWNSLLSMDSQYGI